MTQISRFLFKKLSFCSSDVLGTFLYKKSRTCTQVNFFNQIYNTRCLIKCTSVNELSIEYITRWREDMNSIFEWQNNILQTSAASAQNIVFATRK